MMMRYVSDMSGKTFLGERRGRYCYSMGSMMGMSALLLALGACSVSIGEDPIPTLTFAGVSDMASLKEGKLEVGLFTAKLDRGTREIVYSIGETDSLFDINGKTGVLSFKGVPDYETLTAAQKADGFSVTVVARTSESVARHVLTVVVEDGDDSVTWQGGEGGIVVVVNENETAVPSYGVTAADSDADVGDVLTYSVSGRDKDFFTIDAGGVLMLKDALDYEGLTYDQRKDGLSVGIEVDDEDGNAATLLLDVMVTDVNEFDAKWSSDSETVEVNEHTFAVNYEAKASDDVDVFYPLTYSVSGEDEGKFTINEATGELTFTDVATFDEAEGADNTYKVTIEVFDGMVDGGGNPVTADLVLTVKVLDKGENVTWSVNEETLNVDENKVGVVYLAMASDSEGEDSALMYTLVGTDAVSFTIDEATGVLSFTGTGPNFESGKTVYDVSILARDARDGLSALKLTLNVMDVNDVPVWSSSKSGTLTGAIVTIAEGTSKEVKYTTLIKASDADGDTLTYSLGGNDAGKFDINRATGVLTFKADPDFEGLGSAAGDNAYKVTIIADDGNGGTADLTLTVKVVDKSENVTWIIPQETSSVAENTATVNSTSMAVDSDDDEGVDVLGLGSFDDGLF